MSDVKYTGPYFQFFTKSEAEIVEGLKSGKWPDSFVPAALQTLNYRSQQKLSESVRRASALASIGIVLAFAALVLILIDLLNVDGGLAGFFHSLATTFDSTNTPAQ